MANESLMYFDDRVELESFICYHVRKGLKDIGVEFTEDPHRAVVANQCATYTYVMYAVRGLTRNDLVGLVTSALYRCRGQSDFDSGDPGRLFNFGPEGMPLVRK